MLKSILLCPALDVGAGILQTTVLIDQGYSPMLCRKEGGGILEWEEGRKDLLFPTFSNFSCY